MVWSVWFCWRRLMGVLHCMLYGVGGMDIHIMVLLVAFTLFGFGLHFGPLLMYNAMD